MIVSMEIILLILYIATDNKKKTNLDVVVKVINSYSSSLSTLEVINVITNWTFPIVPWKINQIGLPWKMIGPFQL